MEQVQPKWHWRGLGTSSVSWKDRYTWCWKSWHLRSNQAQGLGESLHDPGYSSTGGTRSQSFSTGVSRVSICKHGDVWMRWTSRLLPPWPQPFVIHAPQSLLFPYPTRTVQHIVGTQEILKEAECQSILEPICSDEPISDNVAMLLGYALHFLTFPIMGTVTIHLKVNRKVSQCQWLEVKWEAKKLVSRDDQVQPLQEVKF